MADARCRGSGAAFVGQPPLAFMPTSSWGCMIFDAIIAIWFLAGAPALIPHIWPSGFRLILPPNQSASDSPVAVSWDHRLAA